jgi:hypothetical protein
MDRILPTIHTVVGKTAEKHNLEMNVVLDRLSPIDILVFGRSGIGKSTLIEAITNEKVSSSAQLDHVTEQLTEISKTIGALKFRFWDTKGIDSWRDSDAFNLIIQMTQREIKPIFVIYCAATGGRVDSSIVRAMLEYFKLQNIPICYVITNIYSSSVEQFQGQLEGGRSVMSAVFNTNERETSVKYCYEYEYVAQGDSDFTVKNKGILIGVNSCSFSNLMGANMPPFNIHELMDFIARNLNDEEFTKFVALTMNNRAFWDRAYDAVRSRFFRIKEAIIHWNVLPKSFVDAFFKTKPSE